MNSAEQLSPLARPSSAIVLGDRTCYERVRAAIQDIAADLPPFWSSVRHSRFIDGKVVELNVRNPTLSSGTAGFALFYRYVSRAFNDDALESLALRYLNESVEAIGEFPFASASSLFDGFLGVAWTLNHLAQSADSERALQQIDALLLRALERGWSADYDLVGGLVGAGVYAIERLPRPAAVAGLQSIVQTLRGAAIPCMKGVTWVTPKPAWQAVRFRRSFSGPYIDLGMAHGVAGIIAFLSRLARVTDIPGARDLLADASMCYESHVSGRVHSQTVPAAISEDHSVSLDAGNAWCYGSPGVSIGLLAAAHVLGHESLYQTAITLAESAAISCRAKADEPGLCHGVAGKLHLFSKLYMATGRPPFRVAAENSLRNLLDLRQPKHGIGGYVALIPDPRAPERRDWSITPGFLDGSAGIGLALVATISNEEPGWDRVLLAADLPTTPSLVR